MDRVEIPAWLAIARIVAGARGPAELRASEEAAPKKTVSKDVTTEEAAVKVSENRAISRPSHPAPLTGAIVGSPDETNAAHLHGLPASEIRETPADIRSVQRGIFESGAAAPSQSGKRTLEDGDSSVLAKRPRLEIPISTSSKAATTDIRRGIQPRERPCKPHILAMPDEILLKIWAECIPENIDIPEGSYVRPVFVVVTRPQVTNQRARMGAEDYVTVKAFDVSTDDTNEVVRYPCKGLQEFCSVSRRWHDEMVRRFKEAFGDKGVMIFDSSDRLGPSLPAVLRNTPSSIVACYQKVCVVRHPNMFDSLYGGISDTINEDEMIFFGEILRQRQAISQRRRDELDAKGDKDSRTRALYVVAPTRLTITGLDHQKRPSCAIMLENDHYIPSKGTQLLQESFLFGTTNRKKLPMSHYTEFLEWSADPIDACSMTDKGK